MSEKKDTQNCLHIFPEFVEKQQLVQKLQLNDKTRSLLNYLESDIRKDLNCKTQKRDKSSKHLSQQFLKTIHSLNRSEKVAYYVRQVNFIQNLLTDRNIVFPYKLEDKIVSMQAYIRSLSLRRWRKKKLRLDQSKHFLFVEKDQTIRMYDLVNYMLRISKSKDYNCMVLEAVNDLPNENARTVHIGFNDKNDFSQWRNWLSLSTYTGQWETIKKLLGIETARKTRASLSNISYVESEVVKSMKIEATTTPEFQNKPKEQELTNSIRSGEGSISLDSGSSAGSFRTIMEETIDNELGDWEESQMKVDSSENKMEFFRKILPDYELELLSSRVGYNQISKEPKFTILQHKLNPKKYKVILQLSFGHNPQTIMTAISQPECMKQYHNNIESISIKARISSQNSAILYQQNKPYNKMYRARDFVYLRHIFTKEGNIYMIDKKYEFINVPPFVTMVRGNYNAVWGIFVVGNSIQVVIDCQMSNNGILNDFQEKNVTLMHLKEYRNLAEYLAKNDVTNVIRSFDYQWDIGENAHDQAKFKKMPPKSEIKQEKQQSQQQSQHQKELFDQKHENCDQMISESIYLSSSSKYIEEVDQTMQMNYELNASEVVDAGKMKLNAKQQFDKNGRVIIGQDFIKNKYLLEPLPKQEPKYKEIINGHAVWKGEWIHDDKNGSIIFVNKKKIEDQKNVIKFILTNMTKNLFSGKSILNVSLPVDIFARESNLQRLLFSMTYAPIFLQKTVKAAPLERLLSMVAFGLSNSILYLDMEKPFNPVLGQTFQCWVNGCPAYAQQISHHPPTAGIYWVGRGYTISAQLESKIQLHVNSGTGTNDGVYKVRYDDGCQICFITPGGEVSGLAYGDRKFNIVGKSQYWIPQENIVLELVFNPSKKGGLFAKKQNLIDYFEGEIYKVKEDFYHQFVHNKRRTPKQSEVIQNIGKIHGTWNKQTFFNDRLIVDFDQEIPVQLEYEPAPLPSDANWREDISYRKLLEVSNAQTFKETIEVQQRADRKLREKFHKNKKK